MSVSYNRLWKLLIDKKMSQSELRKEAGIAPNTMTKMRRDEAVNLAILSRICDVLDCDLLGMAAEPRTEYLQRKQAS